ncbi:histone deacetylase family protein [Halorarius litoreus]|uniref:histone deacetylase family protein n=1 Tax=Halorarius litoreus TaxID=2962676 RepID=UPI0020CC8783|nr:histone deacetylase [Halorarius litoreus]
MRFGYRDVCLRHDTGPRHPETSDRLRAIRRGLSKEHGVSYQEGEPATREQIEAVHDVDYVAEVESFCAKGGGTWDADTVAVGATWDAALAAAGLATWAGEAALDGSQGRETPFAIGRPPGHHAEYADAMGFCFFNNAGVAAQAALDRGDAERVAIVDWDVHHGNGIQNIFYDRADVFYASIHERGLFPGTGNLKEKGRDDGLGTTLNVPYPGGCGDPEYLAAVDDLLDPALDRFDPDLLIVSAGFDAHRNDPISRMRVSTEGYGLLARRLTEVAEDSGAPIAFVLEGGYGLDALADSIRMVNQVFDGYEPATPDDGANSRAQNVLDELRDVHDL